MDPAAQVLSRDPGDLGSSTSHFARDPMDLGSSTADFARDPMDLESIVCVCVCVLWLKGASTLKVI